MIARFLEQLGFISCPGALCFYAKWKMTEMSRSLPFIWMTIFRPLNSISPIKWVKAQPPRSSRRKMCANQGSIREMLTTPRRWTRLNQRKKWHEYSKSLSYCIELSCGSTNRRHWSLEKDLAVNWIGSLERTQYPYKEAVGSLMNFMFWDAARPDLCCWQTRSVLQVQKSAHWSAVKSGVQCVNRIHEAWIYYLRSLSTWYKYILWLWLYYWYYRINSMSG